MFIASKFYENIMSKMAKNAHNYQVTFSKLVLLVRRSALKNSNDFVKIFSRSI